MSLRSSSSSKVLLALLAIAVVVACAGAWIASTGSVTAVEFYNSGLKQYLIAVDPQEITTLDAGKGWTRSGGQFTAYRYPWPGRAPVCRFAGAPGKSPDSQFLTADANECAMAKRDVAWAFENTAFYAVAATAGSCPASTYPVWRDRFSTPDGGIGYRLTTDLTAYSTATRAGVSAEGIAM